MKMNEEIKEILEKPNVYSFNDECYLYFGDYNKLKYYITNLQKENKHLKEANEEHRKINGDLRKENQKLVKVIDGLEKWLKENIFYGDDDYYDMKAMGVESALNKLTELKGGSDEK